MILGIFITGNLNNHALIKLVNSEFNFTSMQVISASRFTTLPSTIPTFWFLFQKLFHQAAECYKWDRIFQYCWSFGFVRAGHYYSGEFFCEVVTNMLGHYFSFLV